MSKLSRGDIWGLAAQLMSDLAQSLRWTADEARFLDELQAGSETAFDWLVTYYHTNVYNLVYGILSNPADAADVTQDVFLHAFRGIHGFHRGSSLKTWLYRISVRQALNHRRWCWRHLRFQISIDAADDEKNPALNLKDNEASPLDWAEAHEIQGVVRRALAQVPTSFRSAVILRDLEGLSYEEVAEVLEVSIGTVKSRILRGRRILKEILDPVLHGSPVRLGEPTVASALAGVSSPVSAAVDQQTPRERFVDRNSFADRAELLGDAQ